MPIKIQSDLPARSVLEKENIFVMTEQRAKTQDIRPLKIALVNLMPTKIATETQILRLLGNTPLQVEISLVHMENHKTKHTRADHLERFYITSREALSRKFDGMIITGAPVEQLPFEQVAYWDEVAEIMQWSRKHAYSTFHICWGAQAGLYYHYGVPKHWTERKIFGVFEHRVCVQHEPLLRGFDDIFYVPHSRHTETRRADIARVPELTVLSEGDAGAYIIANLRRRQFFITGHAEYDPLTLKTEYDRDLAAGLNPDIPCNYYPGDDPNCAPVVRWRSVAHLLFANWLNYYQGTPYELDSLDNADDWELHSGL